MQNSAHYGRCFGIHTWKCCRTAKLRSLRQGPPALKNCNAPCPCKPWEPWRFSLGLFGDDHAMRNPTYGRHNYSTLTEALESNRSTEPRDSCHGGIRIPNLLRSFSQLKTELSGRRAALTYSPVLMGINRGFGIRTSTEACSRISRANSNHEVRPAAVIW